MTAYPSFQLRKTASRFLLGFFHVSGSFLCIINNPYEDPPFSVLRKHSVSVLTAFSRYCTSCSGLSFPSSCSASPMTVQSCWQALCALTRTLSRLFTELPYDSAHHSPSPSLKEELIPSCGSSEESQSPRAGSSRHHKRGQR